MDVKGTAFLARQTYVGRERGAEAFAAILAEMAVKHPIFATPIVATTRIPLRAFLALNDEILARLYDNDTSRYYLFGEASGEWGLTVGPYKSLLAVRNVERFVASVPTFYKSYFSEGLCDARLLDENRAELRMSAIPNHVYFEFGVSGYFKRGLELVSGRSATHEVVRGFSKGDADVLHILTLGARF